MELSKLARYAKEKFNIQEEYKWATFPGFSVLVDPATSKWVALLMQQKDKISGEKITRCDIKCGRDVIPELSAPYLSSPFRMRGQDWVGVTFDDSTDPETVYKLFNKSLTTETQNGFTIILEPNITVQETQYQEIPLTFSETDTSGKAVQIPEKLRQMRKLYAYGDSSFKQKCKNFYVQGHFMVDYEDDMSWHGDLRRYFTTYHDLGVRQLRGYFSWRTEVRKGNYQRITTSLAYLYLYELINGIGTSSVEESLQKMQAFEIHYLDSGIGDESMRKNLHKWLFEFAIINGIAAEQVYDYADTEMLKRDKSLMMLREPSAYDDQEIFDALCVFGSKKIVSSLLNKNYGEHGIHLFAEVWRKALDLEKQNLFTTCFGTKENYRWHPLANAVYYQVEVQKPLTYKLNESRTYSFEAGIWQEQSYQNLYFNKDKLDGLLRETDRMLRLYLKMGYPLKKQDGEAWVTPYIELVIATDKKKIEDSSKPKIIINFSALAQIRQNAFETQDSLLTEEEIDDGKEIVTGNPNKMTDEKEAFKDTQSHLLLDSIQVDVLNLLIRAESVKAIIADMHGMPEVIADALNEALFDEIGDSVVTCDGETISLVEDYRDDVIDILRGDKI